MATGDASHAVRSSSPDAADLQREAPSDSGVRTITEPVFAEVYQAHFDFVWRSVRRLGVADGTVDDVVQEAFLVVHRRLSSWEARSSLRTWLFGVVVGVVRNHRRSLRRRGTELGTAAPDEEHTLDRPSQPGPHTTAVRAEAVRVLYDILDGMEDDRREVFVLAELEQMTAPEIAEALDVKENTVYSRLRAARREFDQAVARKRAQDAWRFG